MLEHKTDKKIRLIQGDNIITHVDGWDGASIVLSYDPEESELTLTTANFEYGPLEFENTPGIIESIEYRKDKHEFVVTYFDDGGELKENYYTLLKDDDGLIDTENESSNNAVTADPEDNDNETDDKDKEDEECSIDVDSIELTHMDPQFIIDCMSIPTCSKMEYRMVAFIIMWARRNNIKYEFDSFGNIYLTKGKLDDGEYYPCVTSHLDTVQYKQEPYIYAGVPLDLEISIINNTEHKLSVKKEGNCEIGIGADDKGGICICLSLFKHVEKLKACFFLDEETGCNGSEKLDKDWFKDVGYVIGYDSPDLYRAAWSCSGVLLFSREFYLNHMKTICDSWGLVSNCFNSEPYTDVKNIREKTDIMCMNFGNGGYNAHNVGGIEFCVMEHMNQACSMGVDLINSIGNTRHILKYSGIYKSSNPTIEEKPKTTFNQDRWIRASKEKTSSTNNATTNDIKMETVQYIVNRYEALISGIKEDVLKSVKDICEKENVDFASFESAIKNDFSNEIKF